MIRIDHVLEKNEKHSCDNCNRVLPFTLKYSFQNNDGKEYNKLTLCEDCANAVANLFYAAMETGGSYVYDYDEISKRE